MMAPADALAEEMRLQKEREQSAKKVIVCFDLLKFGLTTLLLHGTAHVLHG